MACMFWIYFAVRHPVRAELQCTTDLKSRQQRLGYGPSSSQDRIGLLQVRPRHPLAQDSVSERFCLQETTALPFVGMLACIAIFPSEKDLFHRGNSAQSVFHLEA